jgi:hypothetical protein
MYTIAITPTTQSQIAKLINPLSRVLDSGAAGLFQFFRQRQAALG